MRQAILNHGFGIENIEWREVPRPEPGPGEVLVGIHACSLNYRDYLVATGRYNPKMPLPRVPLSDGAGEVLALGPGVTEWQVGDRVAALFMSSWLTGPYHSDHGRSALGGAVDGVLAEEVVLPASALVAIPPHLSAREAATLPCAAVTAWNALFASGKLRPGQTVLVQGSGGVSVFALQLAKLAGARVIATSSHAEKIEKLRALGADWVINYQETPAWGKLIAKAGGVDHVVEVGGVATLEQSLDAVKASGTVSVIGVLTGIQGAVNIAPILHKHLHVQGIYVGSRDMFRDLNQAISQAHLRPVMDTTFAAAEIQLALRYLESAAHFGKIVLEF